MQWYSASDWEHHSLKHLKENLPIHPDDPKFSQQFACVPGDGAIPHTSKQNLPHEEVIRKWAELHNNSLKKSKTWKVVKLPFHVLKLGALS